MDYKGYSLGVKGFIDEVRTRFETTKINNIEVQYFRDSQYADGEPSVTFPQFKGVRHDETELSYY
ncbi:hypothetical protein ABNX05_17995 [Lysinibacillus sp. M3]|uniref:Uncharacterized protein n=1 Tax=Lysinibacillus zambalensis TaxID=3160866 RepID=A0ABV1MVI7_9BACI